MSGFCVLLVLKTGFYKSKLLGFQNCASFEPGQYSSDTCDFMDRLELMNNAIAALEKIHAINVRNR